MLWTTLLRLSLPCTQITSGKSTCIIIVMYRPGSASVSTALLCIVLARRQSRLRCRIQWTDLHWRGFQCATWSSGWLRFTKVNGLFDSYGFLNCVTESTHIAGGLLDVVAIRRDLPLPLVTLYDPGLSDHCLLQWSVPVSWPDKPVVSVVRWPGHQLDVITLSDALQQSQLCRPEYWTNRSVNELALLYDSELSSLLDSMVPVVTVTCRRRQSDH